MKKERIRILYIVDNLRINNGVSTVAINYFKNINHNNFQIDFLVLNKSKNEKNVYDDEIIKNGGNIFYGNCKYSIKNIFKIKSFIKDFFCKNLYDMVELHVPTLSYLILNSNNFNVTPIRIIHTHSSIKSSNKVKNFINSILNFNIKQYADYYFGCSNDSGKYWFGKNITNKNSFFVIPNGTNIKKYSFDIVKRKKLRKDFNIEDKLVIGFVGRISKDKNLEFIINVMNDIKNDNIKLFLIGSEGNDYEHIKKLIEKQKNIEYLGFRNDTNDLYNMLDCLVLCSKKEGLPMVVVEAQLNKLKCLVSETITKEVDIGLCKYLPLNIAKWSNEINNTQSSDIRKCNIDESRFDIEQNAKEVEKIYEKIVGNRRNGL